MPQALKLGGVYIGRCFKGGSTSLITITVVDPGYWQGDSMQCARYAC